jgi:hypothetical protein
LTAIVAVGVLALAGCGGDGDGAGGDGKDAAEQQVNTFEGQTPEQILARAKSAAQDATSVHMTASFGEAGSSFKIDMVMSDAQGGQGSITIDGEEMSIRQVGDVLYIKGSETVWSSMVPGAAESASKLDGTWVKVKKGDSAAARFEDITSMDKAFEGLLKPSGKQLSKVEGKDVEGTPTIGLLDRGDSEDEAATLYIAARGPAYPMLVEPKTGEGQVSFTGWGEDVTVEAPGGKTVDLVSVLKD